MTLPVGDLEILREYSCGCQIYLDQAGHEFTEAGLFCSPETHKTGLTRGRETQPSLFERG